MSRNLEYQFYNAIQHSFKGGGIDKHSTKRKGEYLKNVYSYAERSNLIDMAVQLSKYIRENHSEIKMVKDDLLP